MCSAAELSVPLTVETGVAQTGTKPTKHIARSLGVFQGCGQPFE
ncbi:MAG: hypothetical protein CM15mP68_7050 [Pseudomonadota bacterium]|nr:MAG: hypothetical protein CM15mP68_7050 [Pseudomonadota bacterium]